MSSSKPRKFSVLLLYPDYMSDNYGQETYYAFVTAENKNEAVTKARLEAMNAEGNHACDDGEDFHELLVTEGWNHGC